MSVATILTTSTEKGTVYYHINVKVPLRSITVLRRYSDFTQLVDNLCKSIKISAKDFPYELPPKKSGWFSSSDAIVQERTASLSRFINSVVHDRELQNHPLVHSFLELPVNFKFSETSLQSGSRAGVSQLDDLILPNDYKSIDVNRWLEYSRKFRHNISELQTEANNATSITNRVTIREKVTKVIKPNLTKLEQSLQYAQEKNLIDQLESKKRKLILSDVSQELANLLNKLERNDSRNEKRELLGNVMPGGFGGGRVFGGKDTAQETSSTLPLNNKELLQQQIQVHKEQDQDIEQLRKIIQRQRQIGEAINVEVAEQNEILDQFSEDVDKANTKLSNAKGRIRKLG